MTTFTPLSPPALTGAEIRAAVFQRLEKYNKLGFLEHFAMFMGMAQILEFGLKGLLLRKYGVEHEVTERWTLGKSGHELKARGLRPDFCALLESVVSYRNYIAHEILADHALFASLSGRTSARFEVRELEKATYELEQRMFLHDWCEENNEWK